MLVITREVGQATWTIDGTSGHEVLIRVLSCTGNRIRLGIEAPAEVAIKRDEIRDKPRRTA